MTKIDIFSGFLGAGKTTLIKKLIKEAYKSEKLVLIENEFGEIGIDGGFLKDAGINITEMNSGCICCSLVGDFKEALEKVITEFSPDRIIIEPSGVGKLSDVKNAVLALDNENAVLGSAVTVADAKKCKMYIKNFGEFYNNQLENADAIILSRTAELDDDKIKAVLELIREKNEGATVVTTDWAMLSGEKILSAIEKTDALENELIHGHHHHHHDEHCECGYHHEHHHDEHCECGHHHEHHHDEHCECGHHHEHHHDEHCECGHHHEHHHDEHCECGHHHEHHHDEHCECGHHHADEVFESVGITTAKKYTVEEISDILDLLDNKERFGMVLRAKGYVANAEGESWLHFDYVPEEKELRDGVAEVIGRVCVIGSGINKNAIEELFNA